MNSVAAFKTRWFAFLPSGSLRARYASGAFWMMIGTGAAQALTAICGIVIARVLEPEGYGKLAIVTSTIGMFNVVAELSLGLTTNKHVAEFRKSDPARAGRIIALATMLTVVTGALIMLLVALFAELLAARTLAAPELAQYLKLGAPLLLISAVNGVQMGTLAGYENFRAVGIGRVIIGILALPLQIVGVYWRGISGVIIAQLVLGLTSLLWFRVALRRQSRSAGIVISYRTAWQEWAVLINFALPTLLSGIVYMPVIWAANAILFNAPHGHAEMGKFNAATTWRNLIIWIPMAIGQVALPILTSLLSEGDRGRFTRALKLNIGANLLASLAVATPIALGSFWIMSLYGPRFSSSWFALVMLCGAAVLQATINVIGQVIASASRMWWGFFLNMLWAAELAGFAWLLVGYGANGLGAAYFLAYLLHLVQVSIYTAWVLRYDTRLVDPKDVPKLTPAAAEMLDGIQS